MTKKKSDLNFLTSRESEIVQLTIKCLSRKAIACQLRIRISTVDTHIKNIHLKTGTNNVAGLIIFGLKNVEIEKEDD